MSEVEEILKRKQTGIGCDERTKEILSQRHIEEIEQSLYDLLMEKMPKEVPIKARQTGIRSLQALGYNQAIKNMKSATNALFGRTE